MQALPLFILSASLMNSQFVVAPVTSHSPPKPKVTHEISKFLLELFCRSVTRKIVLDPVQPNVAAASDSHSDCHRDLKEL